MIDLPRAALVDPFAFQALVWPDIYFYDKQRAVIHSVVHDAETYVPAGQKLGKDFVAAFIAVYFFVTRKPVRVVTTSAKDQHLDVLWGEIGRLIQRSEKTHPLDSRKGGPLLVNDRLIRKVDRAGNRCPISYIMGMVANDQSIAAMGGHHANPDTVEEANDGVPRTLWMCDEASSAHDDYYPVVSPWAQRKLIFGNTWDCANFFYRGVKAGDKPNRAGTAFDRKVIRIRAKDSPNVRLGLAQVARGEEPTYELLVPGVKPYAEYERDVETLDPIRKSVVLDAEFYEGKELRMFPSDWLQRAARIGDALARLGIRRVGRALGIDPAEGGDRTAMAVVDEYGVVAMRSERTPNTTDVTRMAAEMAREWGVPPDRIVFDRGGGGKQHADRMEEEGWRGVRSVGFGEAMAMDLRTGIRLIEEKRDHAGERYSYVNRRAQMYGDLRLVLDPGLDRIGEARPEFVVDRRRVMAQLRDADGNPFSQEERPGWGIALSCPEAVELRRQLEPIPLKYDGEGRLRMLPKHKKEQDSDEKCLADLIGCSPDEADAVVLALHGLLHQGTLMRAGVY